MSLWEKKRPIVVGPWGGQGGIQWDDGVYTAIRRVVVVHGAAIDSVRFEYDRKGSSVWSEKHGGDGGNRTDQIQLDYPDEFLTSVCGHYGSLSSGSSVIVKSLTFESNRAKYGPFGFQKGMYFSFPMVGKIVGFHGKAGWYLDSIGFYLKQVGSSNPSKALVSFQSPEARSDETYSYNVLEGTANNGYDVLLAVRGRRDDLSVLTNNYTRETTLPLLENRGQDPNNKMISFPGYTSTRGYSTTGSPVTYGPWGGSGGTILDDGVYTGVRQINLTRNAGITSIKVLYDRNDQAVWGNRNGGSEGIKTDKIIFDFPFEILTHITGYFGTAMVMGPTVVKSLVFHTTRRSYGPYGDEQGTFFSSSLDDGMIVGSDGRSGWYIDCIGVHAVEGKVTAACSPADDTKRGTKLSKSWFDFPRWTGKQVDSAREIEEEDHITFMLIDYRQLPNYQKYDRIISCEMIEGVGHEYMEEFFGCCESLLAENGILVLQFISIPDQRYDEYRRSSDFIKEYIFPGGCLPSLTRITTAMATSSKLCVEHIENIGIHYYHTLIYWRNNFFAKKEKILALGFDEKFVRTWEYYFMYCAAGFKSCTLGNYQIVFSRPGNVGSFGEPFKQEP